MPTPPPAAPDTGTSNPARSLELPPLRHEAVASRLTERARATGKTLASAVGVDLPELSALGDAVSHLRSAPTPAERERAGAGLHQTAPLASHAQWDVERSRAQAADLVASQEAERVPELVALRHERMAASPFAFFRGAALPMAADLTRTPASSIDVQCVGDAHVGNFGMFSSTDHRIVFDVNDFDEAHRAPWEWDVKRLATSLEI